MFAVIKTGGKQYRVNPDDLVEVEKLDGAAGDTVVFPEILMVGGDAGVTLGNPFIAGASVAAEVVEQLRGEKVIAFKKRRRQNSKRKRGHRQHLTLVRISEILTDGAKPSAKAASARPKAEAKSEAGQSEAGKSEAAEAGSAKSEAGEAKSETAKAAAPEGDASNLSLISGIGPAMEKKLRAAGVQSWHDIAGWSEADVARFDEELGLRGRASREEWVEQAKELVAGKPPRAKVDQAEKASGKDS